MAGPALRRIAHPGAPDQARRGARLGRGTPLTVRGVGFDPHGQFLITLDQGGTSYQLLGSTQGSADGTFAAQVFIPGQVAPGPATVRACAASAGGGIEGCAQQQVSIAS